MKKAILASALLALAACNQAEAPVDAVETDAAAVDASASVLEG